MLDRKKCHKLLDAVLDIVEGGEGDFGYPFVNFDVGNYGTWQEVRIIDNGFGSLEIGYDGDYEFCKRFSQIDDEIYQSCMKHLEKLECREQK